MDEKIIIGLVLLGLILLDATGDALRSKGRQKLHHVAEVCQIGGWILLWALFDFHWLWVLVYVFARVVVFSFVYNAWTGHRWLYLGKSDPVDLSIRWLAGLFQVPYENPNFIIKLMALSAWLGIWLRII